MNVWRAKGLTDVGLGAIADKCHELEELDAGWWSVELLSVGLYHIVVIILILLSVLFYLLSSVIHPSIFVVYSLLYYLCSIF